MDATEVDRFIASAAADDALRAVGHRLGLTGLVRPTRGSALVGVGEHDVLKLMAPTDVALARCEITCLQALAGRLPIATPSVRDHGTLDGWTWVHMSRLKGHELSDVWADLPREVHFDLARQLGAGLAVLHRLEAPAAVPRLDWGSWIAERGVDVEALQRARGCPERLLSGLDAFMATADLGEGRSGWLHTEVMREHLLVEETPTGWRLSGMFDFEPSWVGPVHYEYASVGLFFSAGDAELLGAVLEAAGEPIEPERLFAMAMVHRYARLGWFHERLGGEGGPRELAHAWFSQC